MNIDGTGLENIANEFVTNDQNPDYSPDGSKITYVSEKNSNNEIYIKSALIVAVWIRITDNPASDEFPSWASWGDKIVFVSNRDDENYEIYTINLDGTGLFRLTNNIYADIHPDW